MTNVDPDPLFRSAKLLSYLLSFMLAVIVSVVATGLFVLLIDAPGLGAYLASLIGYSDVSLRPWQVLVLSALVLIQLSIWTAILYNGRRVFGSLQVADVITAAYHARVAARLLWLMLFWGILAHTLSVLAITWHFPVGQRALGISFGTSEVSTAFAALLASFTSQAFVMGAALWQDHREVI